MYGLIIGFGDRHGGNCMMKNINAPDGDGGKFFMIDFEKIIEGAKELPVPEVVDFRVTKNYIAPLGTFSTWGLFSYLFGEMGKILSKNKHLVLTGLDSFVYDPLLNQDFYWFINRTDCLIDDVLTHRSNYGYQHIANN